MLNHNSSIINLGPGLRADARRALWIEAEGALVVADLHLGYAWAHRAQGNLLPLGAGKNPVARLSQLIEEYAPEQVVLLGDIVHAAVAVEGVLAELNALAECGRSTKLRLNAGNHDRELAALLSQAKLPLELTREIRVGPHLLLHGDGVEELRAAAMRDAAKERGGFVILGHEHPAISLSDGIASTVRVPCFLVGAETLVLPAFSDWSSGTEVRGAEFLSACARAAHFTQAVAVLAGKLLPVALAK